MQMISQDWIRDTDDACLHLGDSGAFDDTHLLAPFVAFDNGRFLMWYSGSQSEATSDRVYGLGLATSEDGIAFERWQKAPIFQWPEDGGSVLTPCLLRNADGTLLREDGRLRMWISVTHFGVPASPHRLYHTTSEDGIHWDALSKPLLSEVYSPTVIKDGGVYRMWYVDVSMAPWAIRYAHSDDGLTWVVHDPPVLQMDRLKEIGYRNYPYVTVINGLFCMWFSYVIQDMPDKMVAIGFAHSTDGLQWTMSSQNPLLAPALDRPWESQYCGSPCVIRLPDDTYRMWYGSRHRDYPKNKYYAISTAQCDALNFDD